MTDSVSGLRVGLVTGTMAQQQTLQQMSQQLGVEVSTSLLAYQTEWQSWLDKDQVDAWLICVDWEQEGAGAWSKDLESWLLQVPQPLIIDEAEMPEPQKPEYQEWLQRWREKLRQIPGPHKEVVSWPKQVWLLAASTGGPEAVGEFLAALPPNLDAGFIYLQHTQQAAEAHLLRVLNQKSRYPIFLAEQGRALKPQQVMMLSSRKAVKLNSQGIFIEQEEAWEGIFAPSIDQFICNFMHNFSLQNNGPVSGVIIFSGMGEDGAAACRYAKQRGAKVWTQDPESCVSPYMPIAAAEAVNVDFSASPRVLAQQLAHTL